MPTRSSTSTGSNDLSDIELVDQLLRGVPAAFDLFYQRYQRLIYHCVRVRADAADIDDLVQSFFERLVGRDYHILKLWQRGTSLPIYLSTVIRNFVIDFYRSKNLRQKREEPVGGLSELDERDQRKRGATLKREEISPILELKELRRLGLQAWAKLESRDRVLVCGKLHRELSNEAMAVRLELTEGALRTALFRAQGRLLAGLKTLAPEYFPA